MTTLNITALTTATGFQMEVRPAQAADKDALGAFFEHVSKEDLRFRFLSAIQHVPDKQIAAMTDVDHRRTEDFLAFAPGSTRIIANVMLAADVALNVAEVAVAVDAAYKDRGIEEALLTHAAQAAKARGIKKLQSIESRENHAGIALENKLGFSAHGIEGDPMLVLLEARLDDAA